ncbi:hypothetical protein GCK32_014891, partial [Trichostrongylus colubriformis]
MVDEIGSGHSRNVVNTHSPLVSHRRFEDLGTSSNPIVLGASSVEPRINSEMPRGRGHIPTRSSRRKCPLGAYVEIIEESTIPRVPTTTPSDTVRYFLCDKLLYGGIVSSKIRFFRS